MSVIRVHKNKNFTVMSNVHLRDMGLSLKAKGLLSLMLSLPDNWNYSIAGLCSICKENETAIKSTIKELKEKRYVIVDKKFPNETKSKKYEYVYNIFEEPQEENQPVENQGVENLPIDNLQVENNSLNKRTNILNTDKSNKDRAELLNTDKEKGENINTVDAEAKTLSSEKQRKVPASKTARQRYLDKKAEEIDMLNRAWNICEANYDEETANEIFNTLEHYFKRFTEKTGRIHPILKDKTILDITNKMNTYCDTEYSHFSSLAEQPGAYIRMVDMFFDGDFGGLKGHETNWNLPAFMSDGILNRLGQRLYEAGEIF